MAETGCGLLLDLAHARLAAAQLGMDVREYLSALPVAYLREMHVSGVQRVEGCWGEPWVVAMECGGVSPLWELLTFEEVLEEQVPRLYAAVKGPSRA